MNAAIPASGALPRYSVAELNTAIGNLLVQLAGREGPLDLRAIRRIVRDSFEPVRYEPRDAARWHARLG